MGAGDGTDVFAYNVYRYSPPIDSGPDFQYYADVINGWSSAKGTWFPLSPDSDRVLRKFLASHGGVGELTGITSDSGAGPAAQESATDQQPMSELPPSSVTWMVGGLAASTALDAAAVRGRWPARRARS